MKSVMTVRAKFECESAVEANDNSIIVTLRAVTAEGAGDNAQWSKWTPSGDLRMQITNPECVGAFVPGQEYWIDIAPVEINSGE